MKIVLLGYMASGKSTIGKQLAKEMKISFIDLDEYIEEKEGKSVSEIFEDNGEIYFRKQEHYYLKELLELEKEFILSLGGGTPCYAGNMKVISDTENTESIYLNTSIKVLVDRLEKEKDTRPLVASLTKDKLTEFVAKHLFERNFYYKQAAHLYSIKEKGMKEIITELKELLH